MSNLVPDSCENCRFWAKHKNIEEVDAGRGDCRVNPPIFRGQIVLPESILSDSALEGEWPHTYAEQWCGCHQRVSERDTRDGELKVQSGKPLPGPDDYPDL